MARISFKPASRVLFNGADYEIVTAISSTSVILRSLLDGDQVVAPADDLRPPRSNSDLPKPINLPESYTEEQWKIASDRFSKIEPLIDINRTTEMVSIKAKESRVSIATLYRWLELYESTHQLSSLIPALKLRGGPGKTRLPSEVETIIKDYVKEEYDKNPTASMKKAFKDLKKQCRAAGVDVPHETTLRNRIKKHSKKAGIGNRPGRKRGENNLSAEGTFPGGNFPLDVVQIDHTELDITLVDEVHRKSIGRPYITIAIDILSRMIFGYYISLDPPSFFSTGQALLMGIAPKQKYLSKFGIKGTWDICGLPKTIHADNAQEFRGRELCIFCEEYHINLEWRPVARPKFGGHIERLVGTLNTALHELPGTTFSNPEQRGEYKSDKHAIFTINELDEWVARYITEVYHNTIHSSLGMTPIQKYDQGILGDETVHGVGLPDRIDDIERAGIFLLPAETRTVQREGVSIDGIKYFADVLRVHVNSANAKGHKREFLFRRDPRDISKIYFYDDQLKEYFNIPYRRLGWPAISLWELKAIQKRLHEEKKLRPSEDDLFNAYEGLKRIEDDSADKTKQARRSAEARKHRNVPETKTRGTAANPDSSKSGLWSPELFQNIQTTEDIVVIRSDDHREAPYNED